MTSWAFRLVLLILITAGSGGSLTKVLVGGGAVGGAGGVGGVAVVAVVAAVALLMLLLLHLGLNH